MKQELLDDFLLPKAPKSVVAKILLIASVLVEIIGVIVMDTTSPSDVEVFLGLPNNGAEVLVLGTMILAAVVFVVIVFLLIKGKIRI